MGRVRSVGTRPDGTYTPLTFADQNEKFEETSFTGHITDFKFDKLGNMELTVKIGWDWKEYLLPNITFAQGMPLHISLEPYDGSRHRMDGREAD